MAKHIQDFVDANINIAFGIAKSTIKVKKEIFEQLIDQLISEIIFTISRMMEDIPTRE